jgi:uncharacterized membrane protein
MAMSEKNENSRLEAFSDGVFAIAITLLVLEIKIPPTDTTHSVQEFWHAIRHDWPSWFGFTLSFSIILISWINHHLAFKHIFRSTLVFNYANGFLLFTVVLLPYITGLMAEYFLTPTAQPAISLYCLGMLIHNIGWNFIGWTALHPVPLTRDEAGRKQIQLIIKNGRSGFFIYLVIFICSFWFPMTAMVLITLSWIAWIFMGLLIVPRKPNGDTSKSV